MKKSLVLVLTILFFSLSISVCRKNEETQSFAIDRDSGLLLMLPKGFRLIDNQIDQCQIIDESGNPIGAITKYEDCGNIIDQYTEAGLTDTVLNFLSEKIGNSGDETSVMFCGSGYYGKGHIELSLAGNTGNEITHNFFVASNLNSIYDIWYKYEYRSVFNFMYTLEATG